MFVVYSVFFIDFFWIVKLEVLIFLILLFMFIIGLIVNFLDMLFGFIRNNIVIKGDDDIY